MNKVEKLHEAEIIDGRSHAEDVRREVREKAAKMKATHGITPGLAVVLVGNDPASEVYVRSKGKQAVDAVPFVRLPEFFRTSRTIPFS